MRSNQRITSDASASLNLHHTENFATAAAHANSDTCSFNYFTWEIRKKRSSAHDANSRCEARNRVTYLLICNKSHKDVPNKSYIDVGRIEAHH